MTRPFDVDYETPLAFRKKNTRRNHRKFPRCDAGRILAKAQPACNSFLLQSCDCAHSLMLGVLKKPVEFHVDKALGLCAQNAISTSASRSSPARPQRRERLVENWAKSVDERGTFVENEITAPYPQCALSPNFLLRALARKFFCTRAADDIISGLETRRVFRNPSGLFYLMPRPYLLLIALVLVVLLFGCAGLTVSYFDTKTLQGTVTDTQGAPITHAALTVAGRSTFSDEQGRFQLEFPRGTWELRVFAEGFQETAQPINADDFFQQNYSTKITLEAKAWRGRIVTHDTQKPVPNAK